MRSYLCGDFSAVPVAVRGGGSMESVHLLQLLLPHTTQGVGGQVEVRELFQEHWEEVVLLHLHWRESESEGLREKENNRKIVIID